MIKIKKMHESDSFSPAPTNKVEIGLSEKLQKGIHINDFNEGSVSSFRELFDDFNLNNQVPYIPIYIDSFGGDAYSLLAMLDVIDSAQKPVVTIALGKAMSCGALLLALGGTNGYRFATKFCTIMLHDIASFSFGKMEEIRADFKECERLTNLIFELLDVKCNKSPGYFKKVFADHKHADIYLDSQQAKVHGLIDQVGYPVLVPCIQMELILSENTIEEPKKKGRKKKNI
ncbi:hypothetical protein EBU71_17840 [bacterium]|jgi:ATP-dependent Clp endopeptidase proteolytic subunit ClpP|nr:hypothetical protein [Candidatus Elulimicrobium humile]